MNAEPRPRRQSIAKITKAVRDAIEGHKAAGLPVTETIVEVEGKRIRVRLRSDPVLTGASKGDELGELMRSQMSAGKLGGGIGKREN